MSKDNLEKNIFQSTLMITWSSLSANYLAMRDAKLCKDIFVSKVDHMAVGWYKSRESGSPLHRENCQRIPCQGKHREFEHFAKTQGSLYGQVVTPGSKDQEYCCICREIFKFSLGTKCFCQVSFP